MKRNITILYDNEMKELLEFEGISDTSLQHVIISALKNNFHLDIASNSYFVFPLLNKNGKSYSIHGEATRCNKSDYIFQIDLLGISIKKF